MKYIIALVLTIISTSVFSQSFSFIQATSSTGYNCPDSAPVLAVAFGFNVCNGLDRMQSASTFDNNGTNLSGFNWYAPNEYCSVWFHGHFPSAGVLSVDSIDTQVDCAFGSNPQTIQVGQTISGSGFSDNIVITGLDSGSGTTGTYFVTGSDTSSTHVQMVASFAQPAGSVTSDGTKFTIVGVGQGTNNVGILSAVGLAGSGSTPYPWVGTVWAGGVYGRLYWSFNELLQSTGCMGLANCRWPAWWAPSYIGATSSPSMEVDMNDALPIDSPPGVQRYSYFHDYTSGGDNPQNIPQGTKCTITYDGVAWTTIDLLWVPSYLNGGAGLLAIIWNADTCGGNAYIQGYLSSGTLHVTSVLNGSITSMSEYVTGPGVNAGTTISSGSGSTWTTSGSQTLGSSGSPVNMVVTNGMACNYYLTTTATNCMLTPAVGLMAEYETNSAGVMFIISSGCGGNVIHSPPQANECTGTGAMPLYTKNFQTWGTSISNRIHN